MTWPLVTSLCLGKLLSISEIQNTSVPAHEGTACRRLLRPSCFLRGRFLGPKPPEHSTARKGFVGRDPDDSPKYLDGPRAHHPPSKDLRTSTSPAMSYTTVSEVTTHVYVPWAPRTAFRSRNPFRTWKLVAGHSCTPSGPSGGRGNVLGWDIDRPHSLYSSQASPDRSEDRRPPEVADGSAAHIRRHLARRVGPDKSSTRRPVRETASERLVRHAPPWCQWRPRRSRSPRQSTPLLLRRVVRRGRRATCWIGTSAVP